MGNVGLRNMGPVPRSGGTLPLYITKEVVLSRKRVSLGVGVIGTGVSLQTTGASRVQLRIGVCRATREHRFLELYTGSLNTATVK